MHYDSIAFREEQDLAHRIDWFKTKITRGIQDSYENRTYTEKKRNQTNSIAGMEGIETTHFHTVKDSFQFETIFDLAMIDEAMKAARVSLTNHYPAKHGWTSLELSFSVKPVSQRPWWKFWQSKVDTEASIVKVSYILEKITRD